MFVFAFCSSGCCHLEIGVAWQVCTDMGVEAPISVSMKLGDIGNLFRRVVDASQRPHLSIPETEAGRSHKHYRQLVNRSLTLAAGMILWEHKYLHNIIPVGIFILVKKSPF